MELKAVSHAVCYISSIGTLVHNLCSELKSIKCYFGVLRSPKCKLQRTWLVAVAAPMAAAACCGHETDVH